MGQLGVARWQEIRHALAVKGYSRQVVNAVAYVGDESVVAQLLDEAQTPELVAYFNAGYARELAARTAEKLGGPRAN